MGPWGVRVTDPTVQKEGYVHVHECARCTHTCSHMRALHTHTHACTHVYMRTHLFVHACAHAQPVFLPSVRRPRLHGLLPVMLCEEPGCGRTGQGGYEAWK